MKDDESIIQKSPQEWLAEIKQEIAKLGNLDRCNRAMRISLLRECPEKAAFANGIDDADIIEQMEAYAWENLENDLKLDGDVENNFDMIFALCYLDGLVGGDLITESQMENVMSEISSDLLCDDGG